MTLPELVMMGVVAFVGLPSAWRNPTAAALVASWAFGYVIYLATGNGLALKFYFMADIFVVAVIMCKPLQYRGPYRSAWHQVQCILLERSPWDRIVLAIFPVVWIAYVTNIDDFYRWWMLWILAVAQFLAVGGEAAHSWIDGRKANASAPPDSPPSGMGFYVVRGIGGFG